MVNEQLYKWLTPDRLTTYRLVKWPKRVGAWTPDEKPKLCRSGWHLATHQGIATHAKIGAILWIAEGRGESKAAPDKIAFGSARLVSEIGTLTQVIAVRWAAECAGRVLPIFEARYPNDQRPRQTIEAALAWAADPTPENVADAADAYAVAYAVYAAAYDSAYAYAAYASYAAAYAAAANVAYAAAAANAAAAYAAYAPEERKWQSNRLLELLKKGTP